jgi:hypothetical protein
LPAGRYAAPQQLLTADELKLVGWHASSPPTDL